MVWLPAAYRDGGRCFASLSISNDLGFSASALVEFSVFLTVILTGKT